MLHGGLVDHPNDPLCHSQGSKHLVTLESHLARDGQGRGELTSYSVRSAVTQPVGQVQALRLSLGKVPVRRNPPRLWRQRLYCPPEVGVRPLEQVKAAARP